MGGGGAGCCSRTTSATRSLDAAWLLLGLGGNAELAEAPDAESRQCTRPPIVAGIADAIVSSDGRARVDADTYVAERTRHRRHAGLGSTLMMSARQSSLMSSTALAARPGSRDV